MPGCKERILFVRQELRNSGLVGFCGCIRNAMFSFPCAASCFNLYLMRVLNTNKAVNVKSADSNRMYWEIPLKKKKKKTICYFKAETLQGCFQHFSH